MDQTVTARILGMGSYAPPRRMTNADFERIADTSDEWMVSRTGIGERRIADNSISGSDVAVAACRNALEMAKCSTDEIDLLVAGTVTSDYQLLSHAREGLNRAITSCRLPSAVD